MVDHGGGGSNEDSEIKINCVDNVLEIGIMMRMNETPEQIETKFYQVPDSNLSGLNDKIAKLNKRAIKLGVALIKVIDHGFEDRLVSCTAEAPGAFADDKKQTPLFLERVWHRYVRFHKIEVTGETPKFAGWSFAATLEHTGEGTILRSTPYFSGKLDPRFRTADPFCEHCKVKRNRADTFVCIHDDGRQVQIGRNCVKDFLGHADPKTLAQWAEIVFSASELGDLAEDESWECGCGGGEKRFSLEQFLAYAAEAIMRHGYTSGKAAKEHEGLVSTRDVAMDNMFPPRFSQFAAKKVYWKPSTEAIALAQRALEQVRTDLEEKPEQDRSEFDHNLLVVAKQVAIANRDAGIAAYIVQAHLKHIEAVVIREKSIRAGHFGELKKRYRKQKLTVTGANSFPSQFGETWYVRYVSEEGHILVWKTGNPIHTMAGEFGYYDFTVTDHTEYKGTKNTSISRCKLITEEAPAQLALSVA